MPRTSSPNSPVYGKETKAHQGSHEGAGSDQLALLQKVAQCQGAWDTASSLDREHSKTGAEYRLMQGPSSNPLHRTMIG